jgi:transposase
MRGPLWAGLDVGVETTAICVINAAGSTVHEATCPTRLKSVHRELACLRRRKSARVGLEAATGTMLARGLRNLGYQVDLYEQRQLSKFLRLRRNKTDAGDALGIAEAGRLGAATISKVHIKNLDCQCLSSRLTIRRHLIRQRVALVNLLGRQLEVFGGRLQRRNLGSLRRNVEREISSIFGRAPNEFVAELRSLVAHCEILIDYQRKVDSELKRVASGNQICRRLMEIPGVGPLCALTFYAVVSEPERFARSADIGPYLGLTPRLNQSGLSSKTGRISKMGNRAARTLLVSSSNAFMRWATPDSDLRLWAAKVESRRGTMKARIALARKLSIVMLAIWKNGTSYRDRLMPVNADADQRSVGLDLVQCEAEKHDLPSKTSPADRAGSGAACAFDGLSDRLGDRDESAGRRHVPELVREQLT